MIESVRARQWWWASVRRAVFAMLLIFSITWAYYDDSAQVRMELRTTTDAIGELFFAGQGVQHDADHRLSFRLLPDGRWHEYEVALPRGEWQRIRLDLGTVGGEVALRRFAARGGATSVAFTATKLREAVTEVHDLRAVGGEPSELRFSVEGTDPFIDISLPEPLKLPSHGVATGARSAAKKACRFGLAYFLLDLLAVFAFSRIRAPERVRIALVRAADALSDDGVLRVTPATVVLLAGFAVLMVTYVALDLHQSSIGIWEQIYPDNPVEQFVDLGQARWIRSDEWSTVSPSTLAQVLTGDGEENLSLGGERAPLLATVPVYHVSSIVQAKHFGFFLFDAETGFSWWWAYKTFGLVLSFFWLLMVLTRGCLIPSLLGACWLYSSSFIQWWFGVALPETLIAFALAVTGSLYFLLSQRRVWIALGASMIVYAVTNLVLHLYPPFILPLAYLSVFIVVGVLGEPNRLAAVLVQWRWRLGAGVVGLAVLGCLVGIYLIDAWTTMQTMMATVYPGQRRVGGGDLSYVRTFYGFFEALRFDESTFPKLAGNASEGSNFVLLAPIVLLIVPLRSFLKRPQLLVTSLIACWLLLLVWIAGPLPEGLSKVMQAAGFAWSPPFRTIIGLGVTSIIVVVVVMAGIQRGELSVRHRDARVLVPLVVAAILLFYGSDLRIIDPKFFSWKLILSGVLAASMLATGVALGSNPTFLIGLVLLSLPTLRVNPLMSGLSAIAEKPILVAAKKVGGARGDRWMVVGDYLLSQGLKAQGLYVLSGTHVVPNHKMMHVLDPQSKASHVWNRFGHIVVRSDPNSVTPGFHLIVADSFAISLNVCAKELRDLGVTHLAYTGAVPAQDLRCLKHLEGVPGSGVQLFRLVH